MTATFFEAGKTYRHGNEHGSEGIFDVRYVGTAPAPFEHHSETLGVAFGWLWGPGPNGTWEGLGSYSTPDFHGWEEIPPPPCGASVDGYVCVLTGHRSQHWKHITADGSFWGEADPCGHDDCQHAECIDGPTVYCGAVNDQGAPCLWIAGHKRPHSFNEQP